MCVFVCEYVGNLIGISGPLINGPEGTSVYICAYVCVCVCVCVYVHMYVCTKPAADRVSNALCHCPLTVIGRAPN